MKYSQFKKYLKGCGILFEKAKGSHQKAINPYNGKRTIVPFHGSKEIPEGLRKKILKDLGFKG